MSVDRIRLKDLFGQAIEIADADARAAFLNRECAGDADLRRRVDALLSVHDQPAPALDEPMGRVSVAGEQTGAFAASLDDDEKLMGALVAGRYKLLQEIGEGGMGSVWMAQQTEPVKRFVALKLIKAGMDSKAVLARFDAERQALAMMDHPNIAKVLDGGLHDNRPYFVMELVKGTPITQFCDARKLTPRERLELFVPVCQAIQHAHQKGVIHRDIKPSNVLVALYDDKPVPKVIDFGVAKATGSALTDQSLVTGFGGVVGTPEYMSPEQANFNNLDIDTRSDVYSLGVLLYELLTGVTPVDRKSMQQAALLEVLRIVREVEATRPSLKLSTSKALPSIAANRGTEPARLSKLMKGELDWVLLKALEKDRSRRYDTANALARDIQRYLADEIVEARPPSARYRLQKFARRHKGQVVAASLVLLALLAGIAGTTWGLIRAEQARAEEATQRGIAELKQKEAEERSEEAVFANRRALEALRSYTDELMLTQFATKRKLSQADKSLLQKALKQWQVYAETVGDTDVAHMVQAEGAGRIAFMKHTLGLTDEAIELYRRAIGIMQRIVTSSPQLEMERQEHLAGLSSDLGNILQERRQAKEAVVQYARAIEIRTKRVNQYPNNPEYWCQLAASHNHIANLSSKANTMTADEATSHYRSAIDICERLVKEHPEGDRYKLELLTSLGNLGTHQQRLGKLTEAEGLYSRALHSARELLAKSPDDQLRQSHLKHVAWLLTNLGFNHSILNRHQEAVQWLGEARTVHLKLVEKYPLPDHLGGLANCQRELGRQLKNLGRFKNAENETRQALAVYERLIREYGPETTYRRQLSACRSDLGELLEALKKTDEAAEQFEKAVAIRAELAAETRSDLKFRHELVTLHDRLGNIYLASKNLAAAGRHFHESLAIAKELAAEAPNVSDYRYSVACGHNLLGLLYDDLGKPKQSEDEYRKALEVHSRVVAEFSNDPLFRQGKAVTHINLSLLFQKQGNATEMMAQSREGLAEHRKLVVDFPNQPQFRLDLAEYLCRFANNYVGAEVLAEKLKLFGEAIQILSDGQLTKEQPTRRNEVLGISHYGRARVLHRLKRYEEAARDWDLAVALLPETNKPVARLLRATTIVRVARESEAVSDASTLAQLRHWNGDNWYNLACVFAIAGAKIAVKKQEYADRAMESLLKAVKAGYKDAAHIKRDADLDPIRGREDFKKLMAELEAKATKGPKEQPPSEKGPQPRDQK